MTTNPASRSGRGRAAGCWSPAMRGARWSRSATRWGLLRRTCSGIPARLRLRNLKETGETGGFVDVDTIAGAHPTLLPPSMRRSPRSNRHAARLRNATTPTDPQGRLVGVLACQPFPLDALPEPIRTFVEGGSRAIGCDPSFIALPLLAALASAIGNTRRIRLKRTWTEPSILWAVIVGDSGTMKSPALELALRPVRERQGKAMREYQEDVKKHEANLLTYKRDLQEWAGSKKEGKPPKGPEAPVPDRCWCDDTTVEAIAVLLENQPRGLLKVGDELAGWIGGFDRYSQGKGGDAPKWLEMHGGRPLLIDRKTGDRRMIHIPMAAGRHHRRDPARDAASDADARVPGERAGGPPAEGDATAQGEALERGRHRPKHPWQPSPRCSSRCTRWSWVWIKTVVLSPG